MSNSIFKIKSKYCIKNLFEYLPINKCCRISYGSHELFKILGVKFENYKFLNEINQLINPSYDINKYISYIEKKFYNTKKDLEISYLYKKLFFLELNDAPFNIDLFIENETWIDIINQIKNWKLNMSPDMIDYLFSLESKR